MDQQQRGASYGQAHDEHGDRDPGPCLGCEQADRCALLELACEAFRSFVTTGGGDKWKLIARRPSRATFEQLFR